MKGLYIHIPFCMRKCKYCDFVSFVKKDYMAEDYLDALFREMRGYEGEKIDTIFIGGGTPSMLSAKQLAKLTKMCFDNFNVLPDYEFTIEANPGTITEEKLEAMQNGGINRISVGVQSFNDNELKTIGRIHDAQTAYNTIWNIYEKGFTNINVDIMTALPGQTAQSLQNTLRTAVSLPVSHISAYSLIIEEGTPLEREFSKGIVDLPDDDEDREMYAYTVEFLKENGFMQYEISNFAKKEHECRHNIKYWTGEEYIGLGVAAHSYIGDSRLYNTSDLSEYIKGSQKKVIPLTGADKISEYIITGFRMNKGIDENIFFEKFKTDIKEIYAKELEKFLSLGLMKYSGGRYSLTQKGIDVSNSVLCEFV